eukprot:TRINITY_DN5723_c0_g1_i1.p1 TRINITY_DN5723_c0_g1~~TRINITY_DN5723_c0_g1_i1.p1  ORF type:complete len:537 (+),score=99.89 TRINITY_DN5723_c0_g1_i1:266-1876(+)
MRQATPQLSRHLSRNDNPTSPYSMLYEDFEDTPTPRTRTDVERQNKASVTTDIKGKLDEEKGFEDVEKVVTPDGGCLAWTIVLASFMVSFLQDGFRDSFGLLLPSVSEHFKTGRTEAAMTNSIMTLLTLGSGPLVAFLVDRFGHRIVTIVGVTLSTLGLLFAGFSIEYLDPPSLPILYVTVGLMTGLGFGLMYLPAMDIIELYFDRNLGLATGIAAAGSGIGQLVMAPVIHVVQTKLGLAFTMHVLAASVAFAIFFAFMYRQPRHKRSGSPPYEGVSDIACLHEDVKVVKISTISTEIPPAPGAFASHDPDNAVFTNHASKELLEKETNEGCFVPLLRSYCAIFKSPAMVVLLISHFLMHIAIFAAFAFTSDRATKLGIDKHTTAHLLSIMGISNCIGRIAFGKILDTFRSQAFPLTTMVLLVNAGIITSSDYLTSFIGQAIYAGTFGATFGAYISSVVVILKIINKNKITDSLGVSLLVFALASLVGPAIVGQIYDIYGSYRAGFLISGGIGLSGAVMMPLVHFLFNKTNQQLKF